MGVSGSFLGSAKKLCSLSWCPANALRLHFSMEPPKRQRPGIPVLEVNRLLSVELPASGRRWFHAHSQGEEAWEGRFPPSTHLSSLREALNPGLPHLVNSYSSFRAHTPIGPPPGSLLVFPSWIPRCGSLPVPQPRWHLVRTHNLSSLDWEIFKG